MTWIKLTALLLFYLIVLISLGVFVFMFIGGQTLNLGFPHVLVNFLSYDPLPELMQGATGIIVTVKISLGVGIVLNLLGLIASDKQRGGEEFDLGTVLDEVWKFKSSLFLIGIVVVLPFFMGVNSTYIKLLIFTFWASSWFFIFFITLRLYDWVRGNQQKYRERYLFKKGSVEDSFEGEAAKWQKYWRRSKIYEIKRSFTIFSDEIEKYLDFNKENKLQKVVDFLQAFLDGLEEEKVVRLLYNSSLMYKLIQWRHQVWEVEISEKGVESHGVIEVATTLDRIIDKAFELVIENRADNALYTLFKRFDESIESYKNSSDKQESQHFLDVLSIFYLILDTGEKNPDSRKLWRHYFPQRWKVTRTNWSNNWMSRTCFAEYIDWVQGRINKKRDGIDTYLETVNNELFPDVDNILWSRIITLAVRGYNPERSRIRQIVENPPNFGLASEPITVWVGDENENKVLEDEDQRNFNNTLELAYLLFKNILFTQSNVEKWISDLEAYETSDPGNEEERKRWLQFLRVMENKLSEEKE